MKTINFEKTDGKYTFRDAIILNDDQVLTDEEIEAIKQQRFDNWLAVINTPADQIAVSPPPDVLLDPPADPAPV